MGDRFLLLRDGFEDIPGAGDVRQIDFRFDFFFAPQRTRGFLSLRGCFRGAADVGAHLFRFEVLEGTGVGLFLRHPDYGEHIEDGFTLNFQLPCKIVDSYLTHPPFLVPRVVLSSSSQPHGVSFRTRLSQTMHW